jgi:hypothetical protein
MKPGLKSRIFLAICALVAASLTAPSYAQQAIGSTSGTELSPHFVLGPSQPGKFGPAELGTGATITWGLMPTGVDCSSEYAGCTITALSAFMPDGYLTQIRAAFNAWSSVANLHFVEGIDNGLPVNVLNGASVDIRIGGHPMPDEAHSFFPPVYGDSVSGDIHFNVNELFKTTYGGPGFNVFNKAVHQIGHALGLAHTTAPGSVMSEFYKDEFMLPNVDDIAGMRYLYGPNVVPVPATVLLMMAGLLGLAGVRRRA